MNILNIFCEYRRCNSSNIAIRRHDSDYHLHQTSKHNIFLILLPLFEQYLKDDLPDKLDNLQVLVRTNGLETYPIKHFVYIEQYNCHFDRLDLQLHYFLYCVKQVDIWDAVQNDQICQDIRNELTGIRTWFLHKNVEDVLQTSLELRMFEGSPAGSFARVRNFVWLYE